MINRLYRFHGHGSLRFLFSNGQAQRSEYMTLRYVRSKRKDYRLAIVVSKKVNKSAVVRNRIRRRLYEAVRLLKKDSIGAWSYDMAIIVHQDKIADIESIELHKIVKNLISRAKII